MIYAKTVVKGIINIAGTPGSCGRYHTGDLLAFFFFLTCLKL